MTVRKCHCGRPLHYSDPKQQAAIQRLVDEFGEFIPVTGPDRRVWQVQRDYIALHGLKADELPDLGFQEIPP